MYIWNINALVTDLKNRTITEKHKKRYIIFFWILVALIFLPLPLDDSYSMNNYDVIDYTLFIIINGIVLYFLIDIYKKRSRKDIDFFLAFFSLMTPLLFRYTIWSILLTIVGCIYIIAYAPYHSLDETNLIDVIIAVILEIIINIMFVHYFKKIYN